MPTLERATKFNPMFESEPVTAQYYRRYEDNAPQPYSSSFSSDSVKTLGNDEMQHLYQNSTLTKEVGETIENYNIISSTPCYQEL